MKKPPRRLTWCGEGAGAGTVALGAATGALGAATGALGAATGALALEAVTGTLEAATGALDLEAGAGAAKGAATGALGAGAGAGLAAAGAGAATGALDAREGAWAGILCLALAAEPKVWASSKKVLSPNLVLCGLGMEGMEMGTKGLVVVGLRVAICSLGAAAGAPAGWPIGVNGDENLGSHSTEYFEIQNNGLQ